MSEDTEKDMNQEPDPIPLSEFLESHPPSSLVSISDIAKEDTQYLTSGGSCTSYYLNKPEIQLHCSDDSCNGIRFFRCTSEENIGIPDNTYKYVYLSYICSNCRKTIKTFSLAITRENNQTKGHCYKFGEMPLYGPPTPSRLIKLIGPDREIFLKGRRCENQGLGIGAFVYYRRVVENQKNRILGEILKVSEKLGVDSIILEILKQAQAETQFSKALSDVKNAIPQALLINGHNPLSLLHSALSDGLHDQTDEHCLEIASSIRIVLGELSERLAQALKDEAELNLALTKLMKVKSKG